MPLSHSSSLKRPYTHVRPPPTHPSFSHPPSSSLKQPYTRTTLSFSLLTGAYYDNEVIHNYVIHLHPLIKGNGPKLNASSVTDSARVPQPPPPPVCVRARACVCVCARARARVCQCVRARAHANLQSFMAVVGGKTDVNVCLELGQSRT